MMFSCPPKKKLRQSSIIEMLKKPSSQEEEKKKHTSSASMERGSHVKMKSAGMSSAQGGKSVRGKERSAEMRDVLANAAEHRIQSAASQSVKAVVADTTANNTEDREWRGVPLSSLPCLSGDNLNVPDVVPSPDHTVLVRLPVSPSTVPLPYPTSHSDAWDQYHVRMPCSPKSQYPKNKDTVVPRWSVITEALSRKIKSVEDLERAVLEYNSRYISKWKFRGLHLLLEQEFEEEECASFFSKTLPVMVQLALSLPDLVTKPPPLLLQGTTHSITLSQMQIASLLANAFFCTFPRRNAKGNDTEYARYPDINFNRLFFHKEQRSLEKIKCLLHYFQRVTTKPPTGTVTFTRQAVLPRDIPKWEVSEQSLPSLHISSAGLIEEATGLLQVDFANKYLGGGVLGLGCVQEEIRFVLCPELIVSRLFTQVLDKTEALIITGCEQFSRASGYASTFCWEGPYEDKTPVDQWGRRLCQVTAIDALHFTKQPNIQYEPFYVKRELNKAFAGFKVIEGSGGTPTAVATGNWGCGAFKGNPRLKALIQLAVCGHIGRDLAYFTFGDRQLRDDLFTMYIFLKENNVTVGQLVQALHHHGYRGWSDGSDLFQYVCHGLGGSYDSDTDQEESKDSADVQVKVTPDVKEAEEAAIHPPEPSQSKKAPTNIADCFPEPGRTTRCPLSEEKILQVLSECDRIFESKKCKNKQGAGPTSDSSSHKSEVQRKGEEQESEPRRPDKTPHHTSDSNRPSESPRKGEGQKSESRRPDKQTQSSDSNKLSESLRKAEEQKSESRRADKAAQSSSGPSKLFRLLDEYDRQASPALHNTSEPWKRFSLLEEVNRKQN